MLGRLLPCAAAWLCLACLSCAAGASAAGAGIKKRKAMLYGGGAGGLVDLQDGNFSAIVERKRDFSLALLFTARSLRYGCSICAVTEAALAEVAEAYETQRGKAKHAIFFAVADVDGNRDTFGRIAMTDAPHLYLLPVRDARGDAMKTAQELFNIREYESLTGAKLARRLAEASGVEVRIEGDNALAWAALLLLALLAGAVGNHVDGDFGRLVALARNKRIWMAVSLVVYGFGVSGSVSCIIRGTALYNRYGGGPSLFSAGGRDQFVMEGLAVALLCVAIAVLVVVAHETSRRAVDAERPVWLRGLLGLARLALTTLAVAGAVVLLARLFQLYTFKTAWYRLSETVPPVLRPYLQGPAKVKKSSGLVLRLLKFSHFAVSDAKSFAALAKRFDALLLSYFRRQLPFLAR